MQLSNLIIYPPIGDPIIQSIIISIIIIIIIIVSGRKRTE
jgi:hypothetical protein